jgi:hypothetical protein
MEHLITASVISGVVVMAAGVGFSWMHRGVIRKRNDYRIGQALRRGMANPEGVRPIIRVVQWQSCESTSARWS